MNPDLYTVRNTLPTNQTKLNIKYLFDIFSAYLKISALRPSSA